MALAGTLGYLFKTACSQFSDALDIPPGFGRELQEWTFTVISSLTLTAMASAGFGITKTIGESVNLMFTTCATGFSAVCIGASFFLAGRVCVLGTPSWVELADWMKYIK
jgi:hypothetical protein